MKGTDFSSNCVTVLHRSQILTYDSILRAFLLEVTEKLFHYLFLGLLAADVAGMTFDVVNTTKVGHGDFSVAGFVQFLKRLVDEFSSTLRHRRLQTEFAAQLQCQGHE